MISVFYALRRPWEPHYSPHLFRKPHAPDVRFPVATNVNMIPVLAADLIWASSAPCPPWVFMPASAVYSVPPPLKDNVINTERPPIRHHPFSDPPPSYNLTAVDPNTPPTGNHIVNGTRSTGNAVASIRGAVDGPVVLYDPVESPNVGPPNILAVHRGCQYSLPCLQRLIQRLNRRTYTTRTVLEENPRIIHERRGRGVLRTSALGGPRKSIYWNV